MQHTFEFIKPATDIFESAAPTDVVNDERPDGTAIVRRGDGAETLLASSVPDLRLDLLAVYFHGLSLKLNANGGLGVGVKLIPGVPRQQVGLADSTVTNEHDLEKVVLALVLLVRHCKDAA